MQVQYRGRASGRRLTGDHRPGSLGVCDVVIAADNWLRSAELQLFRGSACADGIGCRWCRFASKPMPRRAAPVPLADHPALARKSPSTIKANRSHQAIASAILSASSFARSLRAPIRVAAAVCASNRTSRRSMLQDRSASSAAIVSRVGRALMMRSFHLKCCSPWWRKRGEKPRDARRIRTRCGGRFVLRSPDRPIRFGCGYCGRYRAVGVGDNEGHVTRTIAVVSTPQSANRQADPGSTLDRMMLRRANHSLSAADR